MDNKKGPSFVFIIIAIILGVALYKDFDFETQAFKKPALAIVYFIAFAFSVFILIRGMIKNKRTR